MEPESLLPPSQQHATCPFPEPSQFSPSPPIHLFKIHFNIILPSTPRSSNLSLSLKLRDIPHEPEYKAGFFIRK
jgi:hypothetical protein